MLGEELMLGPLLVTATIGITSVILLYWFSIRNHDYWKKRGIPYVKPLPFIGSVWDIMIKPFHEVECERYKKFGLLYGHFEANKPILSVADPKLLREILVKDFQHFGGRRAFESNDLIVDKMVSVIKGEDWKRIRSIITPTFSTGKIKRMLSIFQECADTLIENLMKSAKQGEPVDAKKLFGTYTMDIIASSAFSTKIDSHNDPDNKFLQVVRKVFGQRPGIKFLLFLAAPWMIKLFRIKIFAPEGIDFFKEVTYQIVEERRKTGKVRNDFLQLLMDTAKEVKEEEEAEKEPEKDILSNYAENDAGYQLFKTTISKKLSMDELVAQCVMFFFAGYDTTGSTLSFASYLLALNPDEQDRLREEVDNVIEANNGKLTYEAIQSMKFLDNVISETLRLFPPLIRTERQCDVEYKLGDTGITILKDHIISIPVFAIHRDSSIYPDPERFNPDRFTPEEREKRDPYVYLPFGAGPRNCVAMRFALVEVKVAIAMVVAKFKIKKNPKTQIPLEFFMSQQGILQPKQILLDLEIRDDCPLVN